MDYFIRRIEITKKKMDQFTYKCFACNGKKNEAPEKFCHLCGKYVNIECWFNLYEKNITV